MTARAVRVSAACLAVLALLMVTGALPVQAVPSAGPGQWFISDYGIDKAWATSTGKGVKVAVIDSGIKASHENLTGRVGAAKDFSGGGKDGTTPVGPAATIKHGTAVAGVIAGNGKGEGPRGVAPDAKLLSASMWLGGGAPDGADDPRDQAAQALRWSVDHGAKVVNMSLGWDDPEWPESWDKAFAYAYSKDAVVIACVGNRSQGAKRAWSPATVPGVIGVGGLAKSGKVASSSSAPGTAVDIMAPAQQIPVPYYEGGYAEAAGCSFAAPIVSGVAALVRSAHPGYSADQTADALLATASPVKGHKGTGTAARPDPIVGFGRLNPKAAVADKPSGGHVHAAGELGDWVKMHRRATAPGHANGGGTSARAEPTPSVPRVEAGQVRSARLGPIWLVGFCVVALACAGGALAFRRSRPGH